MKIIEEIIDSEDTLDELLSRPSPELVEMMNRIDGDIIILGIAGKMGLTLGRMAVRAIEDAGTGQHVIGVARFSDPAAKTIVENSGIEAITCDLLDRAAIDKLPKSPNVLYMAGRKFGTGNGGEALTWAMNVVVPAHIVEAYRNSRIVAFSTGCVYPLRTIAEGGCTEDVPPDPIGEYAQSCLGRERVFEYGSQAFGTEVSLFRLNYAVDMRYGILNDIAKAVLAGNAINLNVSHFNLIWQGEANDRALRCLEQCSSPATPINITGTDNISVREIADFFGEVFNKKVIYTGNEETARMYLNDASKANSIFGKPEVSLQQMMQWTAEWIKADGRDLNKPTHFEVNNGKF